MDSPSHVVSNFNGEEDAYWWLLCTEKHFKAIGTSQEAMLHAIVSSFTGCACRWLLWWYEHHPSATWETFTAAFLWRFKPEFRAVLPLSNDEMEPAEFSCDTDMEINLPLVISSKVPAELPKANLPSLDPVPIVSRATSDSSCYTFQSGISSVIPLDMQSVHPDLMLPPPPKPPDRVSQPPPPQPSKPPDQVSLPLSSLLSELSDWYSPSHLHMVSSSFSQENGLFTTTTLSSSHFLTTVLPSNLQMLPPPLPEPPDLIYFTIPVSMLPLEPTHHLFDEMPARDAAKFFAAEVSRIIFVPYDPGPLVTKGIDTSVEVCLMFRYRVQCKKFHIVAMIYILEYPCGHWIGLAAIEILKCLDNIGTTKVLVDDALFIHNESKHNLLREYLFIFVDDFETPSNCFMCYKFLEEDGLLLFDLEMQFVWDTSITWKCSIEMALGFLRNMLTNLLNCLVIVLATCVLLMAYNKNFPQGFHRVLFCLIKFYTQLKISTQPPLKEALFSQIATLSYGAGCLLQQIAHPLITTSACSLFPLLYGGNLYEQELSYNKYFAAIAPGNCMCALNYLMCVIVQLPLPFAMASGDITFEVHNLVVKVTLNNVHLMDESTLERKFTPLDQTNFCQAFYEKIVFLGGNEIKNGREFEFVYLAANVTAKNTIVSVKLVFISPLQYSSFIQKTQRHCMLNSLVRIAMEYWDPGGASYFPRFSGTFHFTQWEPGGVIFFNVKVYLKDNLFGLIKVYLKHNLEVKVVSEKEWSVPRVISCTTNCALLLQRASFRLRFARPQQWDSGEQSWTPSLAKFSHFKQWDLGKFDLALIFFNLEDKVGVKGNGM